MWSTLQQTDPEGTSVAPSRARSPSLPLLISGWVPTQQPTSGNCASSSLTVPVLTLSSTPAGWTTGSTNTPPDVSWEDSVCNHVPAGKEVVYFTTDGRRDWELSCGITPPLLATVDFSPADNMTEVLATFRRHQSRGPVVNSELYSGWCDWYGQPHQTTGQWSYLWRSIKTTGQSGLKLLVSRD